MTSDALDSGDSTGDTSDVEDVDNNETRKWWTRSKYAPLLAFLALGYVF
jgi:hypothetical protein